MNDSAILQPIFALASWTGLVLLLIPLVRIRAVRRGQVVANDFKAGESASVPVAVSIPNRNYMNLLEVPVLFYVVCLLLYTTAGSSPAVVLLAWSYVVLRIVHSAVHLTYNKVTHRLTAFGASNLVLILLWFVAGYKVFSLP